MDKRPACIKDRCWSPLACTGWGYCRELHWADGWPDAAKNSLASWEAAIAELRARLLEQKRALQGRDPGDGSE